MDDHLILSNLFFLDIIFIKILSEKKGEKNKGFELLITTTSLSLSLSRVPDRFRALYNNKQVGCYQITKTITTKLPLHFFFFIDIVITDQGYYPKV